MPLEQAQSRGLFRGKTRTLRTSVAMSLVTGTLPRAVAKKVRTPPPPRRVQAPQRRETRRPTTASARSPWVYALAGAGVAALIAAAILGFVLLRDNGGGSKTKTTATNYNTLPGI